MEQLAAPPLAGITRRRLLAGGSALVVDATLPLHAAHAQPAAQKVTIAYPTRSGASWPMFIAKDAGYYAKYGLDVTLQFGVHPAGIAMLTGGEAQMANYGIDPVMNAATRDASFVVMGSSLNKGSFGLIARKEIKRGQDLKGKKIGVGRIGDTPYHFTVAMLKKYGIGPREVTWVPSGADAAGRVATMVAGQVDAALLTTPRFSDSSTAASSSTWHTFRNFPTSSSPPCTCSARVTSRRIRACPKPSSRRMPRRSSASTTTR